MRIQQPDLTVCQPIEETITEMMAMLCLKSIYRVGPAIPSRHCDTVTRMKSVIR